MHGRLSLLRALLCARWVADDKSVPPVAFSRLRDRYIEGKAIADSLDALLDSKSGMREQDEVAIAGALMEFAGDLFEDLEARDVPACEPIGIDTYDAVFRRILCE